MFASILFDRPGFPKMIDPLEFRYVGFDPFTVRDRMI